MIRLAFGVHVSRGRGVGARERGDLAAELAEPAEPEQIDGAELALARWPGQGVGALGDDLGQRRGGVVVRHGVGSVGVVRVG